MQQDGCGNILSLIEYLAAECIENSVFALRLPATAVKIYSCNCIVKFVSMDFHLEFTPKPFDTRISHQHKLMLIGSCFTEQIGAKLSAHKFRVMDNPHGILFNPVSIVHSIERYIQGIPYTEAGLFYQNECWNSWDHHSRFSHPDKDTCLGMINDSLHAAHQFLEQADWLLITLGSAFVYELENKEVVANCHKVPTDKFNKRLLSTEAVHDGLKWMQDSISAFNPKLKIIYTISPVRHLRDGFIENNRSKATLIHAVHRLVETGGKAFYFPAYELVIDDLRDYRFYAEDMVHPNYAATNYVWEKFMEACIDEPSRALMKEIAAIVSARNHKPFNPSSEQHKKFIQSNAEKLGRLIEQYPYIDLRDEAAYFAH